MTTGINWIALAVGAGTCIILADLIVRQLQAIWHELYGFRHRCEGCGGHFRTGCPTEPTPSLCKRCEAQYHADMPRHAMTAGSPKNATPSMEVSDEQIH